MKRQLRAAALCLAACLLTGCSLPSGGREPASADVTPSDFPVTAAGVTLSAAPERIVALAPSLADIVAALSGDTRLCGVSTACLTAAPDGVTDVGDQYALNTARLTALDPDLVLTLTMTPELAAWQKAQGTPVAVLTAATELSGLHKQNADVAALLFGSGSADAAAALNDTIDDGLSAIASAIPTTEAPKKALYLPDDSGAAATGDTLWQPVLELLHLSNTAAAGTGWRPPETAEAPDIVLVADGGKAAAEKRFPSAVIVTVPEEIALRGGTGFLRAVRQLAETLYPERFAADSPLSSGDTSEIVTAGG